MCGHSSRRRVAADAHQQPTRRFRQELEPPVAHRADAPRHPALGFGESLPIWSCSVWGLPCPLSYGSGGALLPHLFTLTPARKKHASFGMLNSLARAQVAEAVCFLWHWPSARLEARIPDVIRHTALRSSDFPPPIPPRGETGSDRPAPLLPLVYLEFEPPSLVAPLSRSLSYHRPGNLAFGMEKSPDCFVRDRLSLLDCGPNPTAG